MMNFYEEFGVPNDASVEEIRQAYKTLARVLHPDSQTDEKLKAAAACQMKRLHEILDIFVDHRKRRAYDESLAAAASPNASSRWNPHAPAEPFVQPSDKLELAQSALRQWYWILIGCMMLGSGFWYMTARVPAPAESVPNRFSTTALPNGTSPALRPVEEAVKHEIAAPVTGVRLSPAVGVALPEKSSAANLGSPELLDIPLPAPVALAGLAPAAAYSVRVPRAPAPAKPPIVPSLREPSFTGEWFYVPTVDKPDAHLYPPVDIEFRLTETDGLLEGQYRGRYKVPDAAVSQDVVFQAQGKSPAGSAATLVWTSSDGASGEIDLNLLQPNLMKVTWWTTQLGRQMGLSSGTAKLYRQQTP